MQELAAIINDRDGNEITKAKEALLALQRAAASIDEMKGAVGAFMMLTPIAPVFVSSPQRLFRALPFGQGEACAKVQRMSYPPQDLTRQGRANRPKQQVLYVSTSPVVAVLEAQVAIGQHFVIAEYVIEQTLVLTHAGVYNSTSRDPISTMAKEVGRGLHKHLNEFGRQNLHEASRWLGELFRSEDRTYYPLTTALAESLLTPTDGLIFPSLHEYRQYNIVLNTAAADQKLRQLKHWHGVLNGKEPANGEGGIQSSLYDHSVEIDGDTIKWTGQTPTVMPT